MTTTPQVFRNRQQASVPSTMAIVHRSKARDSEKNVNVTVSDSIYGKEFKDRRNSMVRPLVGVVLAIFFAVAAFLGVSQKVSPYRTITMPPTSKVERFPAAAAAPGAVPNHMAPSQLSYAERLRHPRVVALQNCTVSFQAPANMSFPPIWMPSYPASGAASASKKR
eukprot:scaffold5533_cov159-Amphora_coffeaeformis.AAC.17